MADDWEQRLRENGFRITPQRQLVLEAVEGLRHGTPEEILLQVQQTAAGVNLSTIYRTLEVLESVGLSHSRAHRARCSDLSLGRRAGAHPPRVRPVRARGQRSCGRCRCIRF